MCLDESIGVKLDGCPSKRFSYDTGVRQGDVSSPNVINV